MYVRAVTTRSWDLHWLLFSVPDWVLQMPWKQDLHCMRVRMWVWTGHTPWILKDKVPHSPGRPLAVCSAPAMCVTLSRVLGSQLPNNSRGPCSCSISWVKDEGLLQISGNQDNLGEAQDWRQLYPARRDLSLPLLANNTSQSASSPWAQPSRDGIPQGSVPTSREWGAPDLTCPLVWFLVGLGGCALKK